MHTHACMHTRTYMCVSQSVMSDSLRPHRPQPSSLFRPWNSPGKNTGVGCHFLLQHTCIHTNKNTHWSPRKLFKMSIAYINWKKANYEAHVKLILFWKIVCVCVYVYIHRDMSKRMVRNMWTLDISGLWNSRWFFTFSLLSCIVWII